MQTKSQFHFNASLESLTVSQEGLLDAIKAVFGGGKKTSSTPSKIDHEVEDLDWEQVQKVERFLSDKSLLDSLTLKTTDIDGRWITTHLEGKSTNADTIAQRCLQHAAASADIIRGAAKGTEQLYAFMQKLVKDLETNEDAVHEEVKKAGGKNLNPVKISTQQHQQLLGSTQISWDKFHDTWILNEDIDPGMIRHLHPLSKAQISKIGKTIGELRQKIASLEKLSGEIKDDKLWGPYEGERKPLEAIWEASHGSDEAEEWLFCAKMVDRYGWLQVVRQLIWALEYAVEALLSWIYHSIESDEPSLESLGVSMEKIGWMRRMIEPKGHNDFNDPENDSFVQQIISAGGFVRPFSEAQIAHLEKELGFDVDSDTHRFFKRFGHIRFGSYESFTPAEIVHERQKLLQLERFPRSGVPILKQDGTGGFVTFRDVRSKQWGSIAKTGNSMNYFRPRAFEEIYSMQLQMLNTR